MTGEKIETIGSDTWTRQVPIPRASGPLQTWRPIGKSAEMIASGAHINAIGAIVPSRAEIARAVFDRCDRIVVDSVPQAQKLSRELIDFFGAADQEGWEQVTSLANLVAAGETRAAKDDLTLFKSLGMGISDLALGIELYRKARAMGLGREFAQPERATPRLRVGCSTSC